MILAAARLSDNLVADEQAEFDTDAGEANPFAASLGCRGDIVETSQVSAAHALSIVDDAKGLRDWIDGYGDTRRARVEAVGNDLGENCLIEVAGVGIGEILEEVE